MAEGRKTFMGTGLGLYINGKLATYIDRVVIKVDYDMKEIVLPRKKAKQHKKGVATISGELGGFLYTSELAKIALQHFTELRGQEEITLMGELEDFEAKDRTSYIVSGVQFTSADLANWQVNQEVKVSFPFVADDVRLQNEIVPVR